MIFSFTSSLQPKAITRELIIEALQLAPRRICFASCHKDAFKKEKGQYLGKISFPFKETIKSLFEYETDLTLFPKNDRFWHSIKSGQENNLEKIEAFIQKYRMAVFLRDCLDLSVALSENLSEQNELTPIGRFEDDAKYNNDVNAISEIAKACDKFILDSPYYNTADLICAVPPSDPDLDNLPRNVVRLLSSSKKIDISQSVNWNKKKPALKDLEYVKKLSTLDNFELIIKTDIKNKSIILIDDLYQSGTTMQYIAMKFKEAGASYIYGLSFVKARNDKDYV